MAFSLLVSLTVSTEAHFFSFLICIFIIIRADFEILTKPGNVGYFQSCEVTQCFIQRLSDSSISNLFILVSFEEKPFEYLSDLFLTPKLIPINKDYKLGIRRCWRTVKQIEEVFHKLITENKWDDDLSLGKMKGLSKQFIPSTDGHRINHVLKNNFHNGAYILEFFDESKSNFDFLLGPKNLKLLNSVTEQIKSLVPFDLSVVSDRVGNIVFQFPITILNLGSKALSPWDGVELRFEWHKKLSDAPDCFIQVESSIDKNYMGSSLVEYDRSSSQKVIIGNLDQTNNIKVWRKTPNILLSTFSGSYIREFTFNQKIVGHEPRIFFIGKVQHKIDISGSELHRGKKDEPRYTTFINTTLYQAEKINLEKTLSFKQYFKNSSEQALRDIRTLINNNDSHGVCLWDPYLRSKDILQTLFFSPSGGTSLRAIGAIDSSTNKVYKKKGAAAKPTAVISKEKTVLENRKHNNLDLNLEFRMQHGNYGWGFHDRFLIFPGSKSTQPKVYSLGTSINSIGKSHHIIQELSHPQRIIDAFEELWNKLSNKNCLVWRSPKI